ncbi:MAG: hypothetical protein ACMG5Z_02500 [Luteimonas sp.]
MSPATLSESASVPAALAAFLRGVERRGSVFAELQCGDATCGDSTLAAAMRAFCDGAAASPVSDWPRRFWALLLAAPVLRRSAPEADWPDALSALGRLGNGPRAALLLRLVAGLHEAEAAAVLGIAPPTYRLALQHAVPRQANGTPDEDTWRVLADTTQLMIRQLPPTRLARLAQLREAALQHRRPPGSAARGRPATAGSRPRWMLPALWAGAVTCALAFVATFFLPAAGWRHDDGEPRILREPLAAAESPASRFDAQTAVLTDRDFEMLLAEGDVDAIGDVGFQSWYAAQLAALEPDAATVPIAVPDPDASTSNATPATARPESDDAPR